MHDAFRIEGSDDESSTKSLPEEIKKENKVPSPSNISPEKVYDSGKNPTEVEKPEKIEIR